MDAISQAAAEKATTPCVCSAPGYCHRHAIEKPQRLWELCRTDARYFDQWESGDSPQHKLKAVQIGASDGVPVAASRIPCIHRGPLASTIGCGGCGGPSTAVYACKIHEECTVDRPAEGVTFCGACDDRQPPRRAGIQYSPSDPENGRVVERIARTDRVLLDGVPNPGETRHRSNSAPGATPRAGEPIIIHDVLSPGDITVLTAAVKALHDQYPGRFLTDVRTACPALWQHNPQITPLADAEGRRINGCYDADRAFPDRRVYATVNACNERPIHMLEAYCDGLANALNLPHLTPMNWLQPSILLSAEEKRWASQIQEMTGKPTRFWIVNSGIKRDYTAKRWNGFRETRRSDEGPCDVGAGRVSRTRPPPHGRGHQLAWKDRPTAVGAARLSRRGGDVRGDGTRAFGALGRARAAQCVPAPCSGRSRRPRAAALVRLSRATSHRHDWRIRLLRVPGGGAGKAGWKHCANFPKRTTACVSIRGGTRGYVWNRFDRVRSLG